MATDNINPTLPFKINITYIADMSDYVNNLGQVSVVLGSQWGDEGKGKLVDVLSDTYDIVARAAGGANAGHTIYLQDKNDPSKKKKYVFHLVPSGMLNEKCICLIGNGVVLHIGTMMEEVELLEESGINTAGRLFISDRTHLVFEYHKIIDGLQEEMKGDNKVGTTKRGIGPCYTDKVRRNGIRVHDLLKWDKFVEKYHANLTMLKKMYGDFEYDTETELAELKTLTEKIKPMIVDGAYYLHKAIKDGKKILVEGANGVLLDVDHGTYPFVTSSNPTIGGVATGTGLAPTKINSVIGIMKAYTTRVGAGPFPTELLDELGNQIREAGSEYGATTGRPRRCGWLDTVIGRYAVMINGMTDINLTKLDVLSGVENLKLAVAYKYNGERLETFPADLEILEKMEIEYIDMPGWTEDISKARKFEDLPENARNYVLKIEELTECKVSSIGVGVERGDLIFR